MDPFSVLVTLGTTLKIVKEVWEGAQLLQRVYETYTDGDKTLQSIALECSIYGESIKTIGQWLKKNRTATGLTRQMRTSHNAITLIQASMANVLLDLKKFQDTRDRTAMREKKTANEKIKMFEQLIMNKAKQQWAKKFASKGKVGGGKFALGKKQREKSKECVIGGKDSGRENLDDGNGHTEAGGGSDESDDEEDGSDDAGSVFSLGEFADLGNDDF